MVQAREKEQPSAAAWSIPAINPQEVVLPAGDLRADRLLEDVFADSGGGDLGDGLSAVDIPEEAKATTKATSIPEQAKATSTKPTAHPSKEQTKFGGEKKRPSKKKTSFRMPLLKSHGDGESSNPSDSATDKSGTGKRKARTQDDSNGNANGIGNENDSYDKDANLDGDPERPLDLTPPRNEFQRILQKHKCYHRFTNALSIDNTGKNTSYYVKGPGGDFYNQDCLKCHKTFLENEKKEIYFCQHWLVKQDRQMAIAFHVDCCLEFEDGSRNRPPSRRVRCET